MLKVKTELLNVAKLNILFTFYTLFTLSSSNFSICRLREQDLCPNNIMLLKDMLSQYFDTSSFKVEGSEPLRNKLEDETKIHNDFLKVDTRKSEQIGPMKNLFLLPFKVHEDLQKGQYESYSSMLGKLRDQVILFGLYSNRILDKHMFYVIQSSW